MKGDGPIGCTNGGGVKFCSKGANDGACGNRDELKGRTSCFLSVLLKAKEWLDVVVEVCWIVGWAKEVSGVM